MRKHLEHKKCCCALCKPHKREIAQRWKSKEFAKLRRFERHVQSGWYEEIDENGLQSAATRPQMAAHYAGADLALQTALLIEGIAGNHPFLDGNKRTAAIAALLFLQANGYDLHYQQFGLNQSLDEFGDQILYLVTHQLTAEEMAIWVRTHLVTPP